MNGIVESNGCYFLKDQVDGAHGHDDWDPIGREAFVNHLHIDGKDHATNSRKIPPAPHAKRSAPLGETHRHV